MQQELLQTKVPLRFGENGKIRILTFSDIHGGKGFSPQLPVAVEAIVRHVQPDFVLFGGDNGGCDKQVHLETKADLRQLLDAVCAPMAQQNIPWAHVFGNHDNNYGLSKEEQQTVYEEYPLCVSKRGPRDIDGVANYMLPVLSADGSRIAYAIWGLDSHNNTADFLRDCGLPQETQIVLPQHFCCGRSYDMPHPNQVFWYYETSRALEAHAGAKVPGILFMHVPVPEMHLVYQNREECKLDGAAREEVGCGELNTGLFAACLQRGDIKTMAFGHDHVSDYTGEYCGVLLSYMGSVAYDCYQDDDLRGARVYEVDEADGSVATYMVRLRELLGEAADKKESCVRN